MQIEERLCQIQGHEGQKLSHICIFVDCQCNFRWLCFECCKKQIHNHQDGLFGFSYFKTENQFFSHFRMKIQPLIELKLKSYLGFQRKNNYLKKVHLDINGLISQSNEQFNKNLVYLQRAIDRLQNYYEIEDINIQQINQIHLQFVNCGLKSFNNNDIKILLTINNMFFEEETQIYYKIISHVKRVDQQINNNTQQFHNPDIIQKIYDVSIKLYNLKDYINFSQNYQIGLASKGESFQEKNVDFFYESSDEELIANEKGNKYSNKNQSEVNKPNIKQNHYNSFSQDYKIIENFMYPQHAYISQKQDQLIALDKFQVKFIALKSKNLIRQLIFKNYIKIAFYDDLQKFLILYDYHYIYYFIISCRGKSNKLIKKHESDYYIKGFYFITLDKIMIKYDNLIEIRDFKFRCNGYISFYKSEEYEKDETIDYVQYGRVQSIIVIKTSINKQQNNNIYIFRDNKFVQPVIEKSVDNDLGIKIKQITLASNDTLLLTQDDYEIKVWQIDYQSKQLIQVNKMSLSKGQQYFLQYNSFEYSIIRLSNSYLEIFDENFNKSYQTYQMPKKPLKILISKQFIIVIGYSNIGILNKARTDYDNLK